MGDEPNKGATASEKAASNATDESLSLDQLAGQIAGASENDESADKAEADKQAKVSTKPDPKDDEAGKDAGDDTDETEDEDEGEDDAASDDGEDDAASKDEDSDGEAASKDEDEAEPEKDEKADEELTAAERALEKAIESGKLPLGLRKRLDKAEAKADEAAARAEEAEKKLAESEGRQDQKPVKDDVAAIADVDGLRAYEKRVKTVKDFCDDALELLPDDPDTVAGQMREAKVILKDAEGNDDYSMPTMKRWLLNMRREARGKLADDIPTKRAQLESQSKGFEATCQLYPALKDKASSLSKEVQAVLKKMGPTPFSDPDMNAQKHRIAIWALRGRQAEAADLAAAKKNGNGKTDKPKPKPKVTSPTPKGGHADRASRQQQNSAAFKNVESNPSESSFAEALASSMG